MIKLSAGANVRIVSKHLSNGVLGRGMITGLTNQAQFLAGFYLANLARRGGTHVFFWGTDGNLTEIFGHA